METWDAIRARRNVRTYTDQPIADEDLDRILEAGRRAPSASNRQRWEFIAVTDTAQLEALGEVWQGARHIPGAQAAIVLVIPEPGEDRFVTLDQFDLGQATYAMLLAATDLGIGSGHSSIGERDKAREILGMPPGFIPAYIIGLGYPADRPLRPIVKPDRRAFADVVHRGGW
jgi:nitroreductase